MRVTGQHLAVCLPAAAGPSGGQRVRPSGSRCTSPDGNRRLIWASSVPAAVATAADDAERALAAALRLARPHAERPAPTGPGAVLAASGASGVRARC